MTSSAPPKKSLSKKKLPLPEGLSLNAENSRQDVLTLLRELTLGALKEGEYTIALKALELWGKELGLFSGKAPPPQKPLSTMSMAELEALLGENV